MNPGAKVNTLLRSLDDFIGVGGSRHRRKGVFVALVVTMITRKKISTGSI